MKRLLVCAMVLGLAISVGCSKKEEDKDNKDKGGKKEKAQVASIR